MTVTNPLRIACADHGLSFSKLAHDIGVHPSMVGAWAKGRRIAPAHRRAQIEAIVGPVALPIAPQAATGTCEACDKPLPGGDNRARMFCSKQCANRGYIIRRRLREDAETPPEPPGEASPEQWDGVTRYSEPLVRRESYEATCMWCGAVEYFAWTAEELARQRARRCAACNGNISLEVSYASTPSSNVPRGQGSHLVGHRPGMDRSA